MTNKDASSGPEDLLADRHTEHYFAFDDGNLAAHPYWWLLTLDTSTWGTQSGIVAGAGWDAFSGGYRRVNKVTNTERVNEVTNTNTKQSSPLTYLFPNYNSSRRAFNSEPACLLEKGFSKEASSIFNNVRLIWDLQLELFPIHDGQNVFNTDGAILNRHTSKLMMGAVPWVRISVKRLHF